MIVFGGSRSTGLGWEVAKILGNDLGKSELAKFPDGELYIRIDTDVKGKECALIQSTRTNEDLIELLLTLDALRGQGATQVHAVIPYMGYMRQDKIFKKGEALSSKTVIKLVDEVSDSLSMVNCHFLNSEEEAFYHHTHISNLNAIPLLAEYLRSKISKPMVIAPDKGSLGYAMETAKLLNCDFDHLQKTRVSGTEVVVKNKKLDVKGKDVIILDDIISTGGTIVEASRIIRGWRPASINVGCVHGLFLKGVEMFQGVSDRLIATNTLDNPVAKVSVAGVIAKHLKK